MKEAKYITVDEMLELINPEDDIILGMAANEPQLFATNVHKIFDRVKKVNVTNCLPINDADFFMKDEYKDKFYLSGWFYNGSLRKAHAKGNISFIPNHLHLAGKKRIFHRKPRVFISAASMPDKHGYISLSTSNVYEKEAMEAAEIVILEVNQKFPRTFGDVEVHVSDVDYLVKADYEVPAIPDIEPNEKDMIIGKTIASYIKDGDTIQLGIGGMPNAVAKSLYDKKDLGIHTEMFTNEMMNLIKAGVITGKRKTLHNSKHIACFAMGTNELYEFLDNNPSCWILNGNYVNDPHVIGLNDNQISINATLEIDLSGQCASESLGPMQFSGTGGQSDTAVGAQNSKNGKSFIALYSTAMVKNKETGEREEVSKIVLTLKPGAAVSLSRNDIDYVVTEYGCVSLRGTTIAERAELLISIAHPKFRDELRSEAKKIGWLY
ncbi:MAG: acetyl-CoA hydrolase/transferase C-terminal domain-containing protein [Acholeplasma sp.]|nr:acetyl-CoA hydrolase/transferase C-terminal domain-containing protein [Acholeplasma sp.]